MTDIPDDLIEIRDPAIDPEAIMAEIRARVQARRAQSGHEVRAFPTYGLADQPPEPGDAPHDADLYYYLRLANEQFGEIDTAPLLAPSPATRLPIIGPLWARVRGQVHGLVLFYVNRAVAQQVGINRYLVSVLNRLTAEQQAQAERIRQLEAELAERRAP